jgi:proline iminopeptidase
MTAYLKRLTSDDEALSLEAARRWSTWEESTNRLIQDPEGIHQAQTDDKWSRWVLATHVTGKLPDHCRAFARIENHYFVNKGFFPEDGHLIKEAQLAKM